MRINNKNSLLLAVTAAVQLSSLPFASAKHCWKSLGDYGCGKGYYEDGYFTEPAGDNCICCCRTEDGSGFHENTCDSIKSNAKGCGSCMGERACYHASNSKIGDDSCVNYRSCYKMDDSNVKAYSCRSEHACYEMVKSNVGTHSCGIGKDNTSACESMQGSTIGDYSCQKKYSCYNMADSTIGDYSCDGKWACGGNNDGGDVSYMRRTTVRDNSCKGESSCTNVADSTILEKSCLSGTACNGIYMTSIGTNSCGIDSDITGAGASCSFLWDSSIGDNSCQKFYSCNGVLLGGHQVYSRYLTIGNNACNLENVCASCENYSVVPDGACNGDKSDTYIGLDGYRFCNYCSSAHHSTSLSAQYTASGTSGGRRLQVEDLNTACEDLADELLVHIETAIQEHPAFKNFISESITDSCNTGATFSNHFDFIADSVNGTCTIMIDRLSNMRLVNGDELSVIEHIEQKVDEFNPSNDGFTKDYLNATDVVIEKYCDKSSKSSKSKNSITANGAKTKSGKESKSSQAVSKKRKRMRERKSKKD